MKSKKLIQSNCFDCNSSFTFKLKVKSSCKVVKTKNSIWEKNVQVVKDLLKKQNVADKVKNMEFKKYKS